MEFFKATLNWITHHKFHRKNFSKENLKYDVFAGVIVGLILIPQSLAYAQLAGLPAVYGLYASIFPVMIAVLFGTSNYLSTGPVAVLSILTATTITPLAEPGTPAYITYAVALALMSGVLQVSLGLLRAGWLVNFLSHPVVLGFTNAAAIIIASTQLGSLFGVNLPREGNFFHAINNAIQIIPGQLNWDAVALSTAGIAIILIGKKISAKIPFSLLVLIGGTLLSWWMGLDLKTLGPIENPLPRLTIPEFHLSYIYDLVFGVALVSLIGFTETIAIAQTIATKTKSKIDPDRELLGQGFANVASALSGGYPVAGSLSRTAINYNNGAKTWVAAVFCAGTVLITTILFFNFIKFMPQVLLAVVIITSIVTIINLNKIISLFKISLYDGITAAATFVGTLVFAPDLEKGVLLGLAFSLGYFIYRNSHPKVVFLSRYRDGWLRDVGIYNLKQCKNIVLIRLDGPLFFANARYFENIVIEYLSYHPETKHIIIVAGAITEVDSTGAEILSEMVSNFVDTGKSVYMANVKYPVEAMFKRTKLWDIILPSHFFPITQVAVKEVIKIANKQKSHDDKESCPLETYLANKDEITKSVYPGQVIRDITDRLILSRLRNDKK